jgi:hypothetical protein
MQLQYCAGCFEARAALSTYDPWPGSDTCAIAGNGEVEDGGGSDGDERVIFPVGGEGPVHRRPGESARAAASAAAETSATATYETAASAASAVEQAA